MGPMRVIGLSNLAKALSCMAVVQEGPRRSQVTIAGAAGDLALLSELFNSALIQCKVGLKEALRERVFYSQSDPSFSARLHAGVLPWRYRSGLRGYEGRGVGNVEGAGCRGESFAR